MKVPANKVEVKALDLVRELEQGFLDGHDGYSKDFIRGHNLAVEKIIVMLQQKILEQIRK